MSSTINNLLEKYKKHIGEDIIGVEYQDHFFIREFEGYWFQLSKTGLRYETTIEESGYSHEMLDKQYQKSKRADKLKRILYV